MGRGRATARGGPGAGAVSFAPADHLEARSDAAARAPLPDVFRGGPAQARTQGRPIRHRKIAEAHVAVTSERACSRKIPGALLRRGERRFCRRACQHEAGCERVRLAGLVVTHSMQSCSEGVQACRIRCATIGRRNPSAVRLAEHAPDPPAAGDSSPPKGAAERASFKPAGKRGECFFVPLRSLCLKRRPASYVERQRQGQALE